MKHLSWIPFLAVLSCGAEEGDLSNCALEVSAPDRVPTAILPDWESVIVIVDANTAGKVGEEGALVEDGGYREHIQAWDCLDLSWWSPAEPRKVVQVWGDETSCALFERSTVDLFDCDSHSGWDDVYRDQDEDGYYATEGDCNDADRLMSPGLHEVCDDKDNNCDGRSDEDLDCEDIDVLEAGL
jgi:hypothetical protein